MGYPVTDSGTKRFRWLQVDDDGGAIAKLLHVVRAQRQESLRLHLLPDGGAARAGSGTTLTAVARTRRAIRVHLRFGYRGRLGRDLGGEQVVYADLAFCRFVGDEAFGDQHVQLLSPQSVHLLFDVVQPLPAGAVQFGCCDDAAIHLGNPLRGPRAAGCLCQQDGGYDQHRNGRLHERSGDSRQG